MITDLQNKEEVSNPTGCCQTGSCDQVEIPGISDGVLINRWLAGETTAVGRHSIMLLSENPGTRVNVNEKLRDTFRQHYMSDELWSQRIEDLGGSETAEILKELLPREKRGRSGDTGEILATEVAENTLHYNVPIRRLRWKDGREQSLRGDDIVGVAQETDSRLRFLKGEAKSRAAISASVIDEADRALDRDEGRPSRHSVIFVASRLREAGETELAREMELALTESFNGHDVKHLLFVLSGNNPESLLREHVSNVDNERHETFAIGVWIPDHPDFVEQIYSGFEDVATKHRAC